MTFQEKLDALERLIQETAGKHGMEFLGESGEGRDMELDDIYLEDVSGWIFPKGTPKRKQTSRKYDTMACWRLVNGRPVIDFELYDKNWNIREVLKGDI